MARSVDERRCEVSGVLRQGDPRWSKTKVGKSTKTIGDVGCLLTVYAQALRDLGVDAEATPFTVGQRAVLKGAGLVQQPTAAALGLVADSLTLVADVLRPTIVDIIVGALAAGAVVVMHVAYASAVAKGDLSGKHFVLAVRNEKGFIRFADPATGVLETMDLGTIAATVGSREYLLRSVRPLRRA